jgi:hypothetical protein
MAIGSKAPSVLVVGRLLDAFDKDAGGVSGLQHKWNSRLILILPSARRPSLRWPRDGLGCRRF